MRAQVYSINLSKIKGVSKVPVPCARLIEDFGMEGDIHAGDKIKQVSLLAFESIKKQKEESMQILVENGKVPRIGLS